MHPIADMRVRCGPIKLDQLLLHINIIIINPIVLRTIIIIIIAVVNGPVI